MARSATRSRHRDSPAGANPRGITLRRRDAEAEGSQDPEVSVRTGAAPGGADGTEESNRTWARAAMLAARAYDKLEASSSNPLAAQTAM